MSSTRWQELGTIIRQIQEGVREWIFSEQLNYIEILEKRFLVTQSRLHDYQKPVSLHR